MADPNELGTESAIVGDGPPVDSADLVRRLRAIWAQPAATALMLAAADTIERLQEEHNWYNRLLYMIRDPGMLDRRTPEEAQAQTIQRVEWLQKGADLLDQVERSDAISDDLKILIAIHFGRLRPDELDLGRAFPRRGPNGDEDSG